MRGLLSDFISGSRQIRKNIPASLACVLILAIGIGSASAVFTVLYDAVLKPLPYRDARQLVYVHNEFPRSHAARTAESAPDFAGLRAHHEVFSSAAAYFFNDFTMTGRGFAQHVDAVNVSANLFPMLGIRPEQGRPFTADEDDAGSKVVVLSHGFWRAAFGGDPHAVGQSINLDNQPYRIVGVMPADFAFPSRATQMWVPLSLPPARFAPDQRGRKWLQMIARLAPRLTPQSANAALLQLSHSFAAAFPAFYPEKAGWHFSCTPMAVQQTAARRGWLILAFGAVLCVLLIACLNASGLLLVRAAIRRREWAVRAALGASPTRLLRQIFIETGLVVSAGCGAGVVVAIALVRLINDFGPVPNAAVGPWTFIFAAVLAAASTLVVGTLPAATLLRLPLDRCLRSGDDRTRTGHKGWRNALVAAEIGVAIALLFAATGLSRSVFKLLDVPLGFSAERVWSGSIQLPQRARANRSLSSNLFEALATRMSALPGVESASGGHIPFSPSGTWPVDFQFPGRPAPLVQPSAGFSPILPDYFRTLRIPLLEGRGFSPEDTAGARPVAIIDRTFARKYFPGKDPVGKLVAPAPSAVSDAAAAQPYTIVGVVGAIQDGDLDEPPGPRIYVPELQYGQSELYLIVREAPGVDVTQAASSELARLAPGVALFDVETMSERVSDSVQLRRFIAWLLGGFALVGVLLAGLGLHATLAYLVELRRREIAIRIALGANPGDIRSLLARQSFSIAGTGLLLGVLLAVAASRATQSFLFETTTFEWPTVAATLLGFLALALVASWIPTVRSSRVDALRALRDE